MYLRENLPPSVSPPKCLQWLAQGQAKSRSFTQVSNMRAGSEIEQMAHKPVPIWDPSISGSSIWLTQCWLCVALSSECVAMRIFFFFFCQKILFQKQTGRERKRDWDLLPTYLFTLQMARAGPGQNQESWAPFHPGLLCTWKGPKYLGHHWRLSYTYYQEAGLEE